MKNIKGYIDIQLIKNGIVTPVVTNAPNDICWAAWRYLLSGKHTSTSSTQNWAFPTKRDATSFVNASTDGWYLFYGSRPVKKTALNCWYPEDGVVRVNQDTPFWTPGATALDDDVVTFTASIPAPAVENSPRTIRVFGLIPIGCGAMDDISNVSTISGSIKFTILPLTAPCIQDSETIISITYRLVLPPAAIDLGSGMSIAIYNEIRDVLKRSCDSAASVGFVYRASNTIVSSSAYDFDNIKINSDTLGYRGSVYDIIYPIDNLELTDAGLLRPNINVLPYTNTLYHTYGYTVSHAVSMGCFAKTLLIGGLGNVGSTYTTVHVSATQMHMPVLPSVTNPLQNVFKQRGSPTGPFQDTITANTIGTMTGSIVLDYGNWVDPELQKLFKINITTSGDETTSTYNVEVMNYVGGFSGNKWIARTSYFPQPSTEVGFIKRELSDVLYEDYPNWGGTSFRSPDGYRYVLAASCARTRAGVTIYDIISGTKTIYNSSSTSPLNATAVSDGEAAGGYAYVTCADTGLYRINPATKVVQHITSPTGVEKAYQICVKNDANNTLWVLFEGGLCELNISSDSATILTTDWTVYNSSSGSPTFTFTGITDGNWQYVTSMVINPDNLSNDQFLFTRSNIASTASGFKEGSIWWDTTTGTAFNPSSAGISYSGFTWNQTELLKISDSIVCIDGKWWIGKSSTAYQTQAIISPQFGASTMSTSTRNYGNSSNSPRAIRGVVNNVVGGFISHSGISAGGHTGCFFLSSTFDTSSGTIAPSNATYVEFALRHGTTSNIATLETYTAPSVGKLMAPLVYLPNSNLIFSYESLTTFSSYGVTPLLVSPTHSKYSTYKNAFWKKYGWNGSSWVLNHVGDKTTHTGFQDLPGLDGLRAYFVNGTSGPHFVANEWLIGSIGKGLLRDNGTTYTYKLTWDLAPTEKLVINDVVAAAPGLLTDELITFSPLLDTVTSTMAVNCKLIQNKGTIICNGSGDASALSGNNMVMISDQLIPASTDFSFRFKWICFSGATNPTKAIGVATGSGTYTLLYYFSYNASTGNVELIDNTSTVRATILKANLDIEKEFKIERVGSNITAYYDGASLYSISNSSQLVGYTRSASDVYESGWYDMVITYTENRKILRLGSSTLGSETGSFSSRFMGLSTSSVVGDTTVYLGSGVPLLATLDFTTSGSAIASTGTVKVATGAGWLVFHSSETNGTVVTGSAVAHYTLEGM